MADPTIVQLVKTYFTSDFYKEAAKVLDERKYETEKAMSAIIPLILGAMLQKSIAGKESCEAIFHDCQDAERVFSMNYDYELLSPQSPDSKHQLFDKKKADVKKEVANYSGIEPDSVTGLISLAIPAILGLLGKHILRNKLSASGLAGYFSSQENHIAASIPAPLVGLETSFNIVPAANSGKLSWDYSFQKFTTIKWKRWRRVIIITILVIIIVVYLLLAI